MISREDIEQVLEDKYLDAKRELESHESQPLSLDLDAGMLQSSMRMGVKERIELLEKIASELESSSKLRICIGREIEETPTTNPQLAPGVQTK